MKYRCGLCGYIYDEDETGVRFEDLPEDWICPQCGEPKSEFEPVERGRALAAASCGTA